VTTEAMCEKWLEMIRSSSFHDESMINKILMKHNMQYNIGCCVSLSNYNDYLDDMKMSDQENVRPRVAR